MSQSIGSQRKIFKHFPPYLWIFEKVLTCTFRILLNSMVAARALCKVGMALLGIIKNVGNEFTCN